MSVKWLLVNSTSTLRNSPEPRDAVGPFDTAEEAQAYWTEHSPHRNIFIIPVYSPQSYAEHQQNRY